MGQITPEPVVRYLESLNRLGDALTDEVERASRHEDIPAVYPETGALLHMLTLASGAKRILEIGTAIGYSGLWMARALPHDGLLLSVELDPARAARARATFEKGGVAHRVSVMVGDAARLLSKVSGPFDLIFQDGDKSQYEPLLDRLVALLRPGGLLITDNVLWSGAVVAGYEAVDARSNDSTAAISAYNQRLASDSRLRTQFLPVGDGVAVSVKVDRG